MDINQSEAEDSFQMASDWIKSVRKNVNKLKAVTAATCRSEMNKVEVELNWVIVN